MVGPEDVDDQQFVESTVDAIWSQWQENAAEVALTTESEGDRSSVGFDMADLEVEHRSSVFLTDVASLPSCSTPGTEFETELSKKQLSVITDNDALERPEDEDSRDNELEQEDDGQLMSPMFGRHTRFQANVQTPGLKRRKRLTGLHHFVETQLQKRLFKAWDSIEIAFMGSGDMTVSQIVKFLQHSDIHLGETDAAKVQGILEKHVAAAQTDQDMEDAQESVVRNQSNQRRGKYQSPLLSYEGFRQIFHPVDPQEASRWKREFDRDKFRQRQEKEIYGKELTALEEKVRQRLANSAKHMVDTLRQFKCDPRDVPSGEITARCYSSFTSTTWIMETELGKKIKRKSRLYDLCLNLYLKYREQDRVNMIGNVVAYRRFGRIFLKDLRELVRYNKKNRFATDLGAFRVLHARFRQWMICAIYKVPPPAQEEAVVEKDDELEEARDKVVLHWRLDREWRLQGIADNPLHAQRLNDALLAIMENDSVRKETIRGREMQLAKKQTNEDTFLRMETGLKAKLRHSRRSMQQAAISSPTLKKLFQDHEKEVRQRLQLEKRLMLVAYNDRAVHNYSERASSLFGTAAGRPFMYEKAPPFSSISEVAIICSKKVDGISLVIKTNTMEATLPPALGSLRIIMALARWMLNSLSHGLVHCTDHEEEGKQILQSGLEKRAAGEKLLTEGTSTIELIDSFRDAEGQLDAATLGVKKIVELRDMLAKAQQQKAEGEQLMEEAGSEIMLSQRLLPHIPTTKRMITAIRRMYKVVQTKDEIDQMNPELRSILLLKRNTVSAVEVSSTLT
ncbi:hypothetical protein BBJ29_004772 [Phytophthora kernoviae]|uniref:Uncharacterized protein n=1 Tax=Phytophthora kernoviae TaxID=325452 RepID=A0A3F2RKL7_9STRA|nr:hypothetical protein BBP00_00007337 [Phytophthora kernoviae]RLN70888.1 hypothetical protein BBJ29_004772 [Phytophthora kernoviae]